MEDTTPQPVAEEAQQAPESTPAPEADINVTDSFTGIPEAYQGNPAFADKKLEDVLDGYLKQQEVLDTHEKNGLVSIPGEEADPDKVEHFYRKLGKPETAAEYDFKAPEDWPEGLDYSDERAASFAEFAHQNNLTTAQAQGIFKFYHDTVRTAFEEQQTAAEDKVVSNVESLEQFWGEADSDTFRENKNLALRGFNSLADADLAAQIKEDPTFASDPRLLRLMHSVGKKMLPESTPSLIEDLPTGRFPDSSQNLEVAIQQFHKEGKFSKMVSEPHTQAGQAARKEWNALNEKRISLG